MDCLYHFYCFKTVQCNHGGIHDDRCRESGTLVPVQLHGADEMTLFDLKLAVESLMGMPAECQRYGFAREFECRISELMPAMQLWDRHASGVAPTDVTRLAEAGIDDGTIVNLVLRTTLIHMRLNCRRDGAVPHPDAPASICCTLSGAVVTDVVHAADGLSIFMVIPYVCIEVTVCSDRMPQVTSIKEKPSNAGLQRTATQAQKQIYRAEFSATSSDRRCGDDSSGTGMADEPTCTCATPCARTTC